MTKTTVDHVHPMACGCRHCRAPQQAAKIAPRWNWTIHPIWKAVLSCTAFWVFIAAGAALIGGAL